MRAFNLFFMLVLLAGCVPAPETASPSPPPATMTSSPSPALSAPTATPIEVANGPIVLRIFSPADGDVMDSAEIFVVGDVSIEAVLTINEEIYLLSAGQFTLPVTLEEGPNALEIVASDFEGNEVYLILTMTYQP